MILKYAARNQTFSNAVALKQRIDKRMYDGSRQDEEMDYWMRNECNYVFRAGTPPEICACCHAKCTFMDVSCHIPECSGPGYYDPKLVAQRARESRKRAK